MTISHLGETLQRIAQIENRIAELAPAANAPSFQTQLAAVQTPAAPGTPYDALVSRAATNYQLSPALLHAVIHAESNGDPNIVSGKGAMGLMQLMPGTASALGVSNPFDPAQNIDGGARYLRQMLDRFGGDEHLALAAYNAGPAAVQHYSGVPPYAETQQYVTRVLAQKDKY